MKDTAELKLVEQEDIQTDLRGMFRGAVNMMQETVLEEAVIELCGATKGFPVGRAQASRGPPRSS